MVLLAGDGIRASYPQTMAALAPRLRAVTNPGARSATVLSMDMPLKPLRDPVPMLEKALAEWGGHEDLWVFGYGSLIWRPEFDFAERRPARCTAGTAR